MVNVRYAGLTLLATSDATALVGLPGTAGEFAARAARPRLWVAEAGLDRALLSTAGAAVWLAAVWLALGLLAAASSRLPGAPGRLGGRIGCGLLPRALAGLVAGTAGVGVLLAPVAAGADPAPRPTPTVLAPSWPVDPPASAHPVEAPSWPTSTVAPSSTSAPARATPAPAAPKSHPTAPKSHPTAPKARSTAPKARSAARTTRPTAATSPPTSRPTTPEPPTADGVVRVRPGDSLWLLAGRRLGPHATDAQVAAAWPRWYAANRDAIGADPDLIRPGQVLRSPAPAAATPTHEETR